jgi:hypothetical protein
VVRVGPFDPMPTGLGLSDLSAPVRLLKQPLPLVVREVGPNGPPSEPRIDGIVQPVTWWDGPDRIEPEWWHTDTDERGGRDYYRVELASATRLRIGRTIGQQSHGPPMVPSWLPRMTACAELGARMNFSLFEGAPHPAEMVSAAAALGHAGIGVRDLNSLAGVVRAHGAAKEVKLRFVVGAPGWCWRMAAATTRQHARRVFIAC